MLKSFMVNVASVGFYIFFKFNKDLIFGYDLLTYSSELGGSAHGKIMT